MPMNSWGNRHWTRLFVIIGYIVATTVVITLIIRDKSDIHITSTRTQSNGASVQLLKFAREADEIGMLFFRVKNTTLCVGYTYQSHSSTVFEVDCNKVRNRLIDFDTR